MLNPSLKEQPGAAPSQNCLYFKTPALEPVQYSVTCIPAKQGDEVFNWSTDRLGDPEYNTRLRAALPSFVTEAYVPSADTMSGVMLPPERFTNHMKVARDLTVMCPALMAGQGTPYPCEGTNTKRKTALVLSPGGCALAVLTGTASNGEQICLFAHAGRGSLIDMLLVKKGRSSRAPSSIIEAMIMFADRKGAHPKDVTLRSFFAIQWEEFEHVPTSRGSDYAKILEYLDAHPYLARAVRYQDGKAHISLSDLIRLQALEYGVGRIETGLCPLPIGGPYLTTRIPDRSLRKVRNLAFGIHL